MKQWLMKLFWKTSEILLRCLCFCSWLGICHLTVTKWNSCQDFWEGRKREPLKKAGGNLLSLPAKVTGERLILWNNTNDEIGPWNLTTRTVRQMFHPELLEQIQETFCFTKRTERESLWATRSQTSGWLLPPPCTCPMSTELPCAWVKWDNTLIWKGDLLNCQNETGIVCAPVKTFKVTVVLLYWLIESTGMPLLHAIPSMHPALLCWCLNSGIPINNDQMDIKKMDFSYTY